MIALVICSCEKNDDLVAPSITEENSFSCKIGDELFVAQPNGGFLQFPGISVIGPNWVIKLRNASNDDIYINLTKNEPDNTIQIHKADGDQDFLYDDQNSVELVWRDNIYVSHENTGFINITEWENDRKLIFEFDELKLYDENNPTETIILTEGKLNINLTSME